jgi:hypothetical protein
MVSFKRACSFFLFFILNASFLITAVHAQFWHVLPPVSDSDAISAGFSNDQKKVFFIRRDNGVANIWSTVIMDKYGGIIASPNSPLTQVTKFTDRGVIRFFHLLNRPEIVYMRATDNGKDFHIYRIKEDGTQTLDLTPGGDGVTNTIIGASYDGRYVYYTNNAIHRDKVDVSRYDTQQLMTDLIFPNDKDYEVLAWTRDQQKLLVEDPTANTLMFYNIETTERSPLYSDTLRGLSFVNLNPSDLKCEIFSVVKGEQIPLPMDYSPNCKYVIYGMPGRWAVKDSVNGKVSFPLPFGVRPIAIAPKETLLLYLNGSKLYLYDIAKNNSTELASVR